MSSVKGPKARHFSLEIHVATVMVMTPGLRALLSFTTFNLFGEGLEFRAPPSRGQNILIKGSGVQPKKVTPELMAVTAQNKEERKCLLELTLILCSEIPLSGKALY